MDIKQLQKMFGLSKSNNDKTAFYLSQVDCTEHIRSLERRLKSY